MDEGRLIDHCLGYVIVDYLKELFTPLDHIGVMGTGERILGRSLGTEFASIHTGYAIHQIPFYSLDTFGRPHVVG